MKKIIKVLEIENYHKFKCIAGECTDSCCTNWDIDVDKSTFSQYKNKDYIKKHVYKNDDVFDEDTDYAKIKLKDDGRCPFLDQCNYCTIQKNDGAGYLSNTCSFYPRVLNKVGETYELSLDMSCIEAARIVLSDQNKIRFIKKDECLDKFLVSAEIEEDYIQIRDKAVSILQDRRYSLDQRMYNLKNYCIKLDGEDIESEQCYDKNVINNVFLISFCSNINKSLDIQNETRSIFFKEFISCAENGFNIKDNKDLEQNSEKYIEAFEEYDEKYMMPLSYIFENYLVSFVYNNLFPYSEDDSALDGFLMLLVRFSLIKYYLVGNYLENKRDSEEHIIDFLHSFSKVIDHDKNYMEEVLQYLLENAYEFDAALYYLIC